LPNHTHERPTAIARLNQAIVVSGVSLLSYAMAADAPPAAPTKTASVNLQLTMLTKVNPQGLALWDITNKAIDDEGNVDAKKISAKQWAALLDIGKSLEESGRLLATNKVIAAEPGAKLQDEGNQGASTVKDVQRYIDTKPVLFRTHALILQKTGADVTEAATKHDAKKLGTVSSELDTVCESCHVIFWYPQEKK
jgi:hypothetical protein